MRIQIFSILFLFSLLGFAADDSLPDTPWFDHVKKPTGLGEAQLCQMAGEIRTALLGKNPLEKVLACVPEEKTPRAVFLTIGCDKWPGRTYFGTGFSFREAVKTAVEILLANEPVFAKESAKQAKATIEAAVRDKTPVAQVWFDRQNAPGQWDWLRMDVVQAAKPVAGFSVERSRIAMTSLVGFSFGPKDGFAFPPDQITGRCLLGPTRHIDKQQVSNLISESFNWQAMKLWMSLSDVRQGHRICLFETDTFFADKTGNCRLYRGHTLQDTPPAPEKCLKMAETCADRLLGCLDGKSGKFRSPFPVWFSTGEQRETPDTMAELAIAFARLGRVTKNKKYLEAASLALKPVRKAEMAYGPGKRALVISEKEELVKKDVNLPRDVSLLKTNALAILACLELRDAGAEDGDALLQEACRLGLHLDARLSEPGYLFLTGVYLNDGRNINVPDIFAPVEDAALAGLALLRLDAARPEAGLGKRARTALTELYQKKIEKAEIEDLPTSPWVVEALGSVLEADREHLQQMSRLGFAVGAATDMEPRYLDCYGAQKQLPGCTLAAERSWLLGNLARWMRNNGKVAWAQEQLEAILPMLVFQTQAFLDRPGASILPVPADYIGFFRDNLDDYGFALPGQVAQLQSLVAFAEECGKGEALNWGRAARQVAKARKDKDYHPGLVELELVYTMDEDPDGEGRDLTGGFGKVQSRQIDLRGRGKEKTRSRGKNASSRKGPGSRKSQ